jgi:hypothetical protein
MGRSEGWRSGNTARSGHVQPLYAKSSRPHVCRWCVNPSSPSVPVTQLTPEKSRASKILKSQIINSQTQASPPQHQSIPLNLTLSREDRASSPSPLSTPNTPLPSLLHIHNPDGIGSLHRLDEGRCRRPKGCCQHPREAQRHGPLLQIRLGWRHLLFSYPRRPHTRRCVSLSEAFCMRDTETCPSRWSLAR